MIEKPTSWIMVLYDVPTEPTKQRVRIWREFKKTGALYPQMSFCVLPNNKENKEKIEEISKLIEDNGKVIKISTKEYDEKEHNKILELFREERDKQYDEIYEECEEFIEETNLNIRNKKFTQEEVEEMEEVLDGLYRWVEKVMSKDWIKTSPKITNLKECLKKCQESMDQFAELSFPK
jgi:CRISPR/Cas system-associated endoribonuclease Cas2